MKRREFISLLGGAAAIWPLAALAQQPDRMRRIGVLMSSAEGDPDASVRVMAFQLGLETLGWAVGCDLQIDYRWGAGNADATRAAAAELLGLAPDVIVADGGQGLSALRRAARTAPVVFMAIDEPVFYGFVESLARPGGNMTGFTGLEPAVGAKWLELLSEIVPRVKRIAVVFHPSTAPGAVLFSRSAEAAAQQLAMEVIRVPVHEFAEIAALMTMLAREPGGGLIFPIDTFTEHHRDPILELAARHRLPAIFGARTFAVAGGLMSYGIDLQEQFRQAAAYVDRILRGEKPADLPVQAATKFELVLNRKTANALGLTVPESFLLRADEVIE